MFRAVLVPLFFAALPAAAATNGLDTARQALRDGLWAVARTHALRSDSPDARLIVLESYAREDRWADVLKTLADWRDPAGEGFLVYRATALLRTGDAEGARVALGGLTFSDKRFAPVAARLRAELALAADNPQTALRILEKEGGDGVDARMLAADAYAKSGGRPRAEEIWRDVAARTNAPERVRLTAADRLGDPAVLRRVRAALTVPALKRAAGLRLGTVLLRSGTTFEEGANLVRTLVRDAPDADGARDALLAYARASLDRSDWAGAEKIFAEAAETWPDVVRDASFQEGTGWALAGLGRHEAACAAFGRAAELATDDPAKALALVKAGDMLAALGRTDEATARYRSVREKYPETPAGKRVAGILRLRELEVKARSLYGDYRFADAQKIFEELARADPSRAARMEFCIVLCLYGQGNDDEAERRARALTADAVDPAVRAEATRWLAKFSYNREKWAESADLFDAYAACGQADAAAAAEALVWSARAAFAGNDFPRAVSTVARLASLFPDAPVLAAGLLVQGEALIELARFDEAVLVFERAGLAPSATVDDRLRAQLLRADALFAMGADNPARYHSALEAYNVALLGENLPPRQRLSLAFKVARTLEKLKRIDEAVDQYYSQVVLAYRRGCEAGVLYDDESRAVFSRAAFRLADEYESRGRDQQALNVLGLVVASRVPASDEAARRIERIRGKGDLL